MNRIPVKLRTSYAARRFGTSHQWETSGSPRKIPISDIRRVARDLADERSPPPPRLSSLPEIFDPNSMQFNPLQAAVLTHSFIRSGNLKKAHWYIHEIAKPVQLKNRAFPFKSRTVGSLLDALVDDHHSSPAPSRLGATDESLSDWEGQEDPHVASTSSLSGHLQDALLLLESLRQAGLPRTEGMYQKLMSALLERDFFSEAVSIYAGLAIDWSGYRAKCIKDKRRRDKLVSRTVRCQNMLTPELDKWDLLDILPQSLIRSPTLPPLPSEKLLHPIVSHIAKRLDQELPDQHMTSSAEIIDPSTAPGLFSAYDGVRILSTLLYHKQLPLNEYRQLSPLLRLMWQVPKRPGYMMEVILPTSKDKLARVPKARVISWPEAWRPTINNHRVPKKVVVSLHTFLQNLLSTVVQRPKFTDNKWQGRRRQAEQLDKTQGSPETSKAEPSLY